MSDDAIGVATELAMLDIEALAGAGVGLDVETTNEVLKARCLPVIADALKSGGGVGLRQMVRRMAAAGTVAVFLGAPPTARRGEVTPIVPSPAGDATD